MGSSSSADLAWLVPPLPSRGALSVSAAAANLVTAPAAVGPTVGPDVGPDVCVASSVAVGGAGALGDGATVGSNVAEEDGVNGAGLKLGLVGPPPLSVGVGLAVTVGSEVGVLRTSSKFWSSAAAVGAGVGDAPALGIAPVGLFVDEVGNSVEDVGTAVEGAVGPEFSSVGAGVGVLVGAGCPTAGRSLPSEGMIEAQALRLAAIRAVVRRRGKWRMALP